MASRKAGLAPLFRNTRGPPLKARCPIRAGGDSNLPVLGVLGPAQPAPPSCPLPCRVSPVLHAQLRIQQRLRVSFSTGSFPVASLVLTSGAAGQWESPPCWGPPARLTCVKCPWQVLGPRSPGAPPSPLSLRDPEACSGCSDL